MMFKYLAVDEAASKEFFSKYCNAKMMIVLDLVMDSKLIEVSRVLIISKIIKTKRLFLFRLNLRLDKSIHR